MSCRAEDWIGLDWIVQCFTSPPTQYRLYGRRFLLQRSKFLDSKPTQHTDSVIQLRYRDLTRTDPTHVELRACCINFQKTSSSTHYIHIKANTS